MVHVFISYATPDRVIADEVASWLRAAGHEPFLAHDLRNGIRAGEGWKQRLYDELHQVDAVIGVVTSSFVTSPWCPAELGIADARGCLLIPLRAEARVEHPLIQDRQYVDYDQAQPQQARDRVLQAVRQLDDGRGSWRPGDNPFPGLEPFTAARSRVFFGRAAEAREVRNRLRAMGNTSGILTIVGPSGCGKSSLLNAAVVPLLNSDPTWLTVPTLVPGTDPLPELARVLATTATRLELNWSASDVRGRLEAGTDGLRRVADDLLAAGPATRRQRLLMTIDQSEELFTRTAPAFRQRFAELLRDAMTGPVQVVAVMRSEFLDDLRKLPALGGRRIEAYVLAPPEREMLRDVIEQPAKIARLRLDAGLAARLVADTDSGEALPLLAFTLRQLADGLPAGGTLTQARYDGLGGVRGALARHADAVLTEAVMASGQNEREVLSGLTRLVTVDETGRRARRRIKLVSLAEPLRVALRVFVDSRLLLSDTEDGQVWLTVAHEALLTEWRPLDTATADITVALRTARTVEQAAAEWNNASRPEHYLWDDKRLTATMTTLGMDGDGGNHNRAAPLVVELDDEALAFLDATSKRVYATKERERRRRTRTLTVLSTLLVLALIAAGLAVWQQQVAHSAQYTAIARGMVAQADQIRARDPRGALQLGVAADRLDPSSLTHASIQLTLASTSRFRTLRNHTGAVYGVAFAPDGRTLATASADQTVRLWDLSDRAQPRPLGPPLTGHTDAIYNLAFAPDGRTLATASADQTVRLWDLSDRAQPRPLGPPLTGHTDAIYNLAFAPDGRTLATASADQTVRLWDLSDRAQPRPLGPPLTSHTDAVIAVAFAPDGNTLATASTDQTAILWDVSDRNQPQPLGPPLGHTSSVRGVTFAPDGNTLATASTDSTVRLWDLSDRDRPRPLDPPLTSHTNAVYNLAFAPDGRTLATTSADHSVRLWDLSDRAQPRPLGPPLTGHTGSVIGVAFAPDGNTLATTSTDQTTILWDLRDRDSPRPLGPALTGHTGAVYGVAFAPDGNTLATASTDSTVRLWDLSDRDRPRPLDPPLTGHTDSVYGLAFTPDGRTLATTSADHSVRLWDLSDRAQPRPLGPPLTSHTDAVIAVAFAPDGNTLATTSTDQTTILWDLRDRDQPRPLGPPLTDHTNSVLGVAFAPDGNTLATASTDHSVILWDLSDRDRPRPLGPALTGHTGAVRGVAFAPDGNTLATTGDDQTIILWDLSDRDRPRPLGPALTGHTGTVRGVAFAPDGNTLATASTDSTVRLWDLRDRDRPRPLGPALTGHTGAVRGVAFAPDGNTLATTGDDQTIILWDLPRLDRFPGNEVRKACLRAGGPLDKATWEQYAPGVSYQDTCADY